MARIKKYIENDVLTEARLRIKHIFDIFDKIVVLFSGGKDSLVCVHLIWEEAKRRGHDHIDVVFRDEEFIPQSVVDFMETYRHKEWVRLHWFAVPLASSKYLLGQNLDYIQWDSKREWAREKPEWAITQYENDPRIYDQYTMDGYVARRCGFKGSLAYISGVRSDESIIRFRSVVNKLNENYINRPPQYGKVVPAKNVRMVKPVYDWSEDDIFKFLGESNIPYCELYDAQLWGQEGLRVSTPLHAEAAKRLDKLAAIDPGLYEAVMRIFPEMATQSRYYRDLDLKAIRERYLKDGYMGVRRWIKDNLDGHQQAKALNRLRDVMVRAQKTPKAYPADHLLKQFMSGAYKRQILPLAGQ